LSYIDEHGRTILVGQEALDGFARGVSRLLEGRKLHYKTSFQDIPISVENRRGSIRSGEDPDGGEWETKMKVPYGYIPGTEGADGEALDVLTGPDENAAFAYVVHVNNPETEEFDEDKVMLGFSTADAAKKCFLQHYDDPKFFGGIDKIPMWKFDDKIWVKKHTTKKLVASVRGAREAYQNPPSKYGGAAHIFTSTKTFQNSPMRRSMLGHHQDVMMSPLTREVIHKTGSGYQVKSEHGKNLSKKNLSKGKAKKRLAQVEYFKHQKEAIRRFGESKKPQVYYARSLQRYGTAAESGEQDYLREQYPSHLLKYPRTRRHAELGMGYFHKKIDKAKEVVITPLRRNRVTAGVASEATHALHRKIPVRMLDKHGRIRTVKEIKYIKGGKPGGEFARVVLKTRKLHHRKK